MPGPGIDRDVRLLFFFHLLTLAGPANLGVSRVFMARPLRVSLLIYPRESLPTISISLSVCERLT